MINPAAVGDSAPDQEFRAPLQLIAEGVREIVGFRYASISVVRTARDGTEELEVIADAGDDDSSEIIIGGVRPWPTCSPRSSRPRSGASSGSCLPRC